MPDATIVWLRRDLRLRDNPALQAALDRDAPVIPLYTQCEEEERNWPPGAASRWWLHESLQALDAALRKRGSRLIMRSGPALETLQKIIKESGATAVYWNRRYEPAAMERDRSIKEALRNEDIGAESFNGALLVEPWSCQTQSGGPYRVFTAFKRSLLEDLQPARPHSLPRRWSHPRSWPRSQRLDELELLPKIEWYGDMQEHWRPGESGARARLNSFLRRSLEEYENGRDLPGADLTSSLSPHLHFGEISIRYVWQALERAARRRKMSAQKLRSSAYVSELIWREFAHHLLYHYPNTPEEPLDRRFERFSWKRDRKKLEAWQRGRTGYPLVDAGMRQLWSIGWMHNRVRLVTASFLIKNLQIHWLEGARWFWDTLVDADLAANTLNWQWVAGCGADAAPYFRIFNPVTQSKRFDPEGTYIRRWVPELASLESKYIHEPESAPDEVLEKAGIRIGRNYPAPIVDLRESREEALAAYEAMRKNSK